MRKFIVYIILLILPVIGFSQEFNCSVQVTAPSVQGTDKILFEDLRKNLYEFINNKSWTNYTFKQEERIECSMLITVSERISSDEFKGTIQLQLRRPIYRTSYNSVMLNFIDKDFQFKYVQSQTIEYIENAFTTNLTAVVAYYVNIFLGMDFDSYSPNGGSPYFEKAQNIVNLAQSTPEAGWKSYESQKNRYWLVENLLNNAYSAVRQFSYQYHRMGLDVLYDNMETGRSSIADATESLRKAYREKPGIYIIQIIMEAKSDEMINIFKKASPQDKSRVVNSLVEIDPANTGKYQSILSTN